MYNNFKYAFHDNVPIRQTNLMERFIVTDTASVELFFYIFTTEIYTFSYRGANFYIPMSHKSVAWNYNLLKYLISDIKNKKK